VSSIDPFITINDNYDEPGDILSNQNANAYFNFTAHADCLPGHVAILNFHIEGANGYEKDIVGYITIDQILEDWETNSFDTYNWAFYGDEPWFLTTELPYEGTYCLRSGGISHNESSTIAIELQVVSPGTISFFKKVSSEENYDFLKFYIDDIERGSWSGTVDWSENTYSVSAGVHNFKWTYNKDVSVSTNSDCAWIDYIEFPSIYDADPELIVSHLEVNKSLYPNQTGTETIHISNQGGGIINYNIEITADVPWLRNERSIDGSNLSCSHDSFYAGDTVEWVFTALAASVDNEWIEGIEMTFPEGFIIDSLTHFFDQSEDTLLLISGAPGDGGTFNWLGENEDGWGLITPGENASATINGHILEDFQDKMTIYYTLQGDVYGSEPHQILDSIELFNYGPRINWLSASPVQGDLGIGNEDEIVLTFNSEGLIPGTYNCNLRVYTNILNLVIPVDLIVMNQVGVEAQQVNDIRVYPNPSSGKIYFESITEINEIDVYSNIGQKLLAYKPDANRFEIDLGRNSVGIYFIKVITDSEIYCKKVIVQ
ncbi:MAG TPA: T9SS type A sorting domain-containing protein, partial [Bacteroidales bacterium]|nr:T9SS type A sorting domain-containing protein [Bacteroidales bacterium]